MGDPGASQPKTSLSRRERAEATRQRILASAYKLFCDLGYSATTMKTVSEHAQVAVQTVYFVFHTKADLLRAVIEATAAGNSDPPLDMQRPWALEALQSSDGRRTIALTVEHGVDIYRRMAPLGHSVRQAALVEPDVNALWTTISTKRKAGMARLMESLHHRGALRDGLTVALATDIYHALNSHETYLELVGTSGWSLVAYKAWLYDILCRALLSNLALSAPDADSVVEDLSFGAEPLSFHGSGT